MRDVGLQGKYYYLEWTWIAGILDWTGYIYHCEFQSI